MHPNWSFVATEVNEQSAVVAMRNAQASKLAIRVLPVARAQDPLLGALSHAGSVDFCMCNPPFYESTEHIERARASKATPAPSPTVCVESEAIYSTAGGGGEVAFVRRLVEESESLPWGACRWYTTLLGLKSSVARLEAYLGREGSSVRQVKVMPSQVGRTRRWVLAWSFQGKQRRARGADRNKKWVIEVSGLVPKLENVQTLLEELQVRREGQVYETTHRTWNRRARRSEQAEKCHLSFGLTLVGRTIEFALHEGDPTEFTTLINSLRHRLSQ